MDKQRLQFLRAIRGMTPPKFSRRILEMQRTNPVKWHDQEIAKHYGMSVNKVRSLIFLQEHEERWNSRFPELEEKHSNIDSQIKERFGTFNINALQAQIDTLSKFASLVRKRGNKYELSGAYSETLKLDTGNLTSNLPSKDDIEDAFTTGVVRDTDFTVAVGKFERDQKEHERKLKEKKEFEFILS